MLKQPQRVLCGTTLQLSLSPSLLCIEGAAAVELHCNFLVSKALTLLFLFCFHEQQALLTAWRRLQ